MTRSLALAKSELLLSARQGEQLLVALLIPVGVLVFFTVVDVVPIGDGERVDYLTPSVMALAIMSTAMVSLGIATAFDRQYGVLKRLGATPLGRGGLVIGKLIAVLVIEVVQLVILAIIGGLLGWSPDVQPILAALAVVLGTAAFGGIGLLLAGTLRGTVVLGVANALYLFLLAFGGMAFTVDELPAAARGIANLLPSAALSEVLRATLSTGYETSAATWAVLLLWAVASPAAAAVWFRWD